MKQLLITAIIALVVGVGIGYVLPHPSSMQHSMDAMTASLDGKSGDEFDRAFLEEMIVHHQGAVAMAERALTSSGHEELKTLAREIIAAQAVEIAQMKAWMMLWYEAQPHH